MANRGALISAAARERPAHQQPHRRGRRHLVRHALKGAHRYFSIRLRKRGTKMRLRHRLTQCAASLSGRHDV
jgi:hypothetical protein